MRHITLVGRCSVLGRNQFATRTDYPADDRVIQGDDTATIISFGGSCIIDPLGKVLVGPAPGDPTILVADIDLNAIARGKFDFDLVGHDARVDVFRLFVNESARAAVELGICGEMPSKPGGDQSSSQTG